ncbi:MAG: bifunctional hydroxymethylpyrimidine kinase/phosphomethylpyrimidine kinase, partial [Oscillospiraceae bacterium]|nr:bifunctional hydroxymethylpyrimidine kinase/phosphomethylpyrimidine kinase [Oscillospiraceae bacterium]
VPVNYPGTGDIFASVLTGGVLSGDSLPMAMERATRYLELTIKTTYSYGTDTRCGVMLEKTLGWLTQHNLTAGYKAL